MKILIKSGRVIDPANKIDSIMDILVEDNKISKIARNIKLEADKIIVAENKMVLPGLVDMHVHLREPGREDKETICSGTQAALRGGVTSLLAMPNTTPAVDSIGHLKILQEAIKKGSKANVFICAAITQDRRGEEVNDLASLKKEGVVAISDDGASVDSDAVMLEAFRRSKEEKLLVICHSEDKQLSRQGVVNLGFTSTRLGLRGISAESEYKRVARDITLAKETGASVHIAHVSCQESVEIISRAKKGGIKVTCETAPHYFTFNEAEVLGYDTNFKMNPPLRSKEDMLAIRKALSNGTIDVIASDHAPHTENEKDIEFERAECGVVGLETELAASITELVSNNLFNWEGLIRAMSLNPSRILGISKGTLSAGADADIIVVDPEKAWVARKEDFLSKSQNSPFLGRSLKGCVEYTLCQGKVHKWNS
ncbi:MAG: dihydroorotase [Candidatus Omnitrophota bacterium]|jgi:dihydroorotase|nr:dihydroorotase [Candidatus Omnitrophota bacterium]MDD5517768.1 dihydroorotase [Candidatus Omnitrophota bacterium]